MKRSQIAAILTLLTSKATDVKPAQLVGLADSFSVKIDEMQANVICELVSSSESSFLEALASSSAGHMMLEKFVAPTTGREQSQDVLGHMYCRHCHELNTIIAEEVFQL